jgi:hypothetical protein
VNSSRSFHTDWAGETVKGERFVGKRWQRALLSGMLFVPCRVPLASEVWRPTPAEFRDVSGPLGLSLGTWQYLVAFEGVVLGGLMWLLQTKAMTVVLTDGGLVLYGTWKLRWEDVRSARLRTVLGSQYLHVVRRGRLQPSLWVPLYFVGSRPLATALRDHAPTDSPIRAGLDAASTSATAAQEPSVPTPT